MTTTTIKQSNAKIDINKSVLSIEKSIESTISKALNNRVSYANSIQKALSDCIFHALATGKNDLINNLIKAMRKPRRLNGKNQAAFTKSQINKVKQYVMAFADFIIDNESDGINENFPTAIAKGTKQGLQLNSIDELNEIISNLPLFISWKPKPKPKAEKSFSQLFSEWLTTQNKKVEKGELELSDIENSILIDLNDSFNRLPVETDDLTLAKAEVKLPA